jgi:hypothetical protein
MKKTRVSNFTLQPLDTDTRSLSAPLLARVAVELPSPRRHPSHAPPAPSPRAADALTAMLPSTFPRITAFPSPKIFLILVQAGDESPDPEFTMSVPVAARPHARMQRGDRPPPRLASPPASPGTAAGTTTTTHLAFLCLSSALIPHSLCIQVGSGGRRGHPGRHGGCGAAMCGSRRSAGRPRAPAAGHRSGMLLPFTSPTICSPVSLICLSCICSCKKKKRSLLLLN